MNVTIGIYCKLSVKLKFIISEPLFDKTNNIKYLNKNQNCYVYNEIEN